MVRARAFPAPAALPLLLPLACLAACQCGESIETPGADASVVCPCPAGQACGPDGGCVPGLAEGQPCGSTPDGGALPGACLPGLACGFVGLDRRCSVDCTSENMAEVCGPGRMCFGRPYGPSSAGYCGTPAAEGEVCDDSLITKCFGDRLVCLSPFGQTAGRCYRLCDPAVAYPGSECADGAFCAQVFADEPDLGACVVPVGRYPARCDYARAAFCARNELCVRPSADSTEGYCHLRCATSADCQVGEDCASPATGLSICVEPVERCADWDPTSCERCAAEEDRFCGAGDLCVRVLEATVCKQDCTSGQACDSGLCTQLAGTDKSACL